MALTASLQAEVERNEMKFEKATVTFTTTAADGTVTLINGIKKGAPDFVLYQTSFANAAENEEQIMIDSFDTATGIVTIRRDGTSTLISAAVFTLLFIWID